MAVEVYKHPRDVALKDAMLVWTAGERVGVVPHPDEKRISRDFRASVGACFSEWDDYGDDRRRLQLMIEAWHISAFWNIPSEAVHQALLCIPEYRSMLSPDCLPGEYRNEN